MKYKINNQFVVDAKSPIEAAKAIKLIHQVIKDSVTGIAKDYNYKTIDSNIEDVTYICKLKDNCKYDMKTAIKLQNKLQAKGYNAKIMAPDIYVYDSVKDNDDIEYLSEEEKQAIEDYKKAIANTKDPKLLNLFAHILKEEIEHLEELQNSEEEVIDSCKK